MFRMTTPDGLAIRCGVLLALSFSTFTPVQAQQSDGLAPIQVTSLKGDVHAASPNHDVALKVGSVLTPPVTLTVGADGTLEMHQGQTVISAAANSRLDIPKSTDATQTLERISQTQGNVYYSVAKRPSHKLNIETPYLVAVIKGTRFNV